MYTPAGEKNSISDEFPCDSTRDSESTVSKYLNTHWHVFILVLIKLLGNSDNDNDNNASEVFHSSEYS